MKVLNGIRYLVRFGLLRTMAELWDTYPFFPFTVLKRVWMRRIGDDDYFIRWVLRRIKRIEAGRKPFVPSILYAESTNSCNASCVMCPRDSMTRPIGFMDMGMYERLVAEAARIGVNEIRLHNFGEPLLDRDIEKRIRMAKDAGIPVTTFYTNASLLTRERTKKIIESGLDHLFVSFDAPSRQAYESTRRNLRYEKVKKNIETFIAVRNDSGRRTPRVGIFILRLAGQTGIDEFVSYWRTVADSVAVNDVSDWAGEIALETETFRRGGRKIPCFYLWKGLIVLQDGTCSPCCEDFDGKYPTGHVGRSGLLDIWRGQQYRAFRDRHRELDSDSIPLCSRCMINDLSYKDRYALFKTWL
jgi:hypothetical protein